ncbi:uncharacterized protein LOC100893977 [Strongylocentrotus purpuratus]|uniref:Death domain-containing protein n=1 Tax=Strongylocentrotus purpuratus TaxID=7668 RepID=A0A7M7HF45_STRPU|nr:uncharacterized protein LOC100893977 [Strongylocentrotus purpuratus]XP_030854364.1 uncharacterized protein LOC100893977 [Strongylocentrotus purpuratus]XP_030854365.1 uncharacterized protein LOC100893977 [Strongylocentrotus purpuratus]
MPTEPPEYTKLMQNVAKQIESTPDGLMDFRNTSRAQGHVRAFDLDKKRAYDIIRNLQKKMIVHPGQYEKFVEFLEIIGREDVIKMLPGYQDYQSKDGGNNNRAHYNTIPEKVETKIGTSHSAVAGRVTDIEISILSDSIPPDCVLRFGIFLDMSYPEIETQRRQGGTTGMLFHWRKNVPERDQRQQLQQALEEARLGHLVTDCFGNGKNSSRKDTGPLSRSSIISDKILSKLAGKIGEGWSQFGIQHLGMSKVDIDHFKHNRSTMEETIFGMLYEWRQRHHDDATIGKLLDLMEESPNISLDSYSFILEELQSSDLHQ